MNRWTATRESFERGQGSWRWLSGGEATPTFRPQKLQTKTSPGWKRGTGRQLPWQSSGACATPASERAEGHNRARDRPKALLTSAGTARSPLGVYRAGHAPRWPCTLPDRVPTLPSAPPGAARVARGAHVPPAAPQTSLRASPPAPTTLRPWAARRSSRRPKDSGRGRPSAAVGLPGWRPCGASSYPGGGILSAWRAQG